MHAISFGVSIGLVVMSLALTGCGDSRDRDSTTGDGSDSAAPDAFLGIDQDTTPEERRYLEAAKAFIVAVAAGDAAAVYAELSSHARARMSPNQFDPADDEAVYANNESKPHLNVSAELFPYLLKSVYDRFGQPQRVDSLYVFDTDSRVLAGAGDKLDVMFAIGAMPASVPIGIRRASLRGRVTCRLTDGQITELIRETGMTRQEIEQDPDVQPYFNVKLVLVTEGDGLKVGYFEFMPPGILD